MSNRFYDIYVRDPQQPAPPEEIKEQYGLVKLGEDVSVTTVNSIYGVGWSAARAMISSAAKTGEDRTKDWDAKRGTTVHEMFEALLRFGRSQFSPDDYPGYEAFAVPVLDWYNTFEPKPLDVSYPGGDTIPGVEFVVWNRRHGFAGRADAYAEVTYQDRRVKAFLDYKSVGEEKKLDYPPYPENVSELIARAQTLTTYGIPIDLSLLVRVSPEGHHTTPYWPDDWPAHFESYLRAKGEWEHRR